MLNRRRDRGPPRILVLQEVRLSDAFQHMNPETLDRLRTGLRLIALHSLSDAEAAEEVVQETLARGMHALQDDRLDDPQRLAAYFRGICHHVIIDTIRARQRVTSLDVMPERTDGNVANNPLDTLISEERKARVVRALQELSSSSQECLRLSFYEGLKPAEIAKRLGEPGPRVRKRRSRALQQLREAFDDETGSFGCHKTEGSATLSLDEEGSEPDDPQRADE